MAPPFPRRRSLFAWAAIALAALGCSAGDGANGNGPADGSPDSSSGSDAASQAPFDASGSGPFEGGVAADSETAPADDGPIGDGPLAEDSSSDSGATIPSDASLGGDDAGPVSCLSDAGSGGVALLPSQSGSVTVGFDVSVSGAPSSGGIGQISIQDDRGTIELAGTSIPAIVYNDVSGATSFQGIAMDASRWVIFWPYCDGSQLTWVDYETSDAPGLIRSAASGTCAFSASSVTFPFAWPAESVVLNPSSTDAFTMVGPSLSYTGTAPGTASFGGSSWTFWPFAEVDCTTCGSGPGDNGGWYELHSLVQTGASCAQVCFGIFYLYLESGNDLQSGSPVELAWLNCLPDLAPPAAGGVQTFQADWTSE
jgi:hypothetical protein